MVHKPGHMPSLIRKAQSKLNKVVRPTVRRASKATIGVGKVASMAGYRGTGRKITNIGRAGKKASQVRDLKSARTAINAALRASKK